MKGLACAVAFALASGCGPSDWTPPTLKTPLPSASSAASSPSSGHAPSAPSSALAASDYTRGVTVSIERFSASTTNVSRIAFAVPIAPGRLRKLETLDVLVDGNAAEGAKLKALIQDGAATPEASRSIRSVLVELPASTRLPARVELRFDGGKARARAQATSTFKSAEKKVDVTIDVAEWRVESRGTSTFAAVPQATRKEKIFTSVEPPVRALFPPGYLAQTKIFGDLLTRTQVEAAPRLAGMRFLSDAFVRFADGAMGETGYPLAPSSLTLETEAWLYDRCASYLLAYAHGGEPRHLVHGFHSCASYARQIDLAGERRGIFSGKEEPDTKYSHARGLYLYYALSGDEVALEAGRAIAEMWSGDALFAVPYRNGTTRGVDKLWTERLLAASLEGGVYGYLLTGEARFLEDARGLWRTAKRHITTNDGNELKSITKTSFPPQSCFIHNALQQAEGNPDEPWCSSWMSELVVDPLLRLQEVTGDPAIDEVFVRLARSMRDVGTMYFKDNPLNDAFLTPSRPFVMDDEPRLLAPLYGYGVDAKGKRRPQGEWSDFEHCPDATAITAAALRALKRSKAGDAAPTPASAAYRVDLSRFKTERESILALHNELAFCAAQTLERAKREARDPRRVSQSTLANAFGSGDPRGQAKALADQKVGWPVYDVVPKRKLSWWFNTSIAELAWLVEADVDLQTVKAGVIR